MWEIKVFRY